MKGDIVVIPFPFSDLSSSIRRPALIVATLPGDDLIVCQITTKKREDKYQLPVSKKDFISGNLKVDSFIRASKLLSIRSSIVLYKLGTIRKDKFKEIIELINEIFTK